MEHIRKRGGCQEAAEREIYRKRYFLLGDAVIQYKIFSGNRR